MGKGADSLGWLDNDGGLKLANARRRACRSCRSAHERGKRETLATRAWGFKGRGSKREGRARLLDAVADRRKLCARQPSRESVLGARREAIGFEARSARSAKCWRPASVA